MVSEQQMELSNRQGKRSLFWYDKITLQHNCRPTKTVAVIHANKVEPAYKGVCVCAGVDLRTIEMKVLRMAITDEDEWLEDDKCIQC